MKESKIIFYKTENEQVKVEIRFEDETFWLTQKKLAELFGVEVQTINYHLKEIFKSGELVEDSVIRKIRITADDGKKYLTNFYNLDAIIAVGYRVNSYQATQFRIWATNVLKEFLIKGFVLDDERLKQGKRFDKDYFEELLERIRAIRASERRFYQKITDLYAQASVDYDAKAPITQQFYKTVQNKLHWAVTGLTAAEIIAQRVDADKPNMGLTTWKHAPKGNILKSDTQIAKNYLNEKELEELERVVSMYIDFAEMQAKRRVHMRMQDWIDKLDAFLQFNEYDILQNAGKVSAQVAKELAAQAYEQFRKKQDESYESDFDKALQQLKNKKDDKQ
ncbi:MAG: virulence RhuM family protein [Phaeodactylibacter sp.]|nr:virulence RhuM family protein [Phaeodactylibacter sp.]